MVRSHAIDLPKKVRALALKHALSSKAKAEQIIVLDTANLADPKTKALKERLEKLGISSVLFVDGAQVEQNIARGAQSALRGRAAHPGHQRL